MGDFINSEETLEIIPAKIIELTNELNFNVNELIACHEELLSNEYSIEQKELMEIQNKSKYEVDESTVKSLIIKNMNVALMHFDKFLVITEERDPNG
ncbi:hypothetical protein HZS_5207 [Henneguya salminicola]|nr:hypothetical protein HZS_5207 [Henneguya salminicola]